MTGFFIAMGGVGTLIATSPLAWLSSAVGWRSSFLLVGILTLVLTVLVYFLVRDRPADMGFPSLRGESAKAESPIGLAQGVRMVLGNGRFWPLGLWFFFTSAIFFSFGGLWGGPWLMHVYGMSKAEAGHILSMLAFGMIAGSPAHSYISDRLVRGRKAVILVSSVLTLVIIIVMTAYIDALPFFMLYILCFGMGMFSNAIVVIGFTSAKELFPLRIAGTATGLINLFPFAGGAVFQPVLGYVLERQGKVNSLFTATGYRNAFLILCGCGVAALISGLFIKETFPDLKDLN
jgi:sugar phosphate permease